MLAARIGTLVTELLPRGRREGHEFVHPSIVGRSQRSFQVHLSGEKAGVWSDFSSGDRGDALDLVAFVRFGGNLTEAMDWARAWLGLGGDTAAAARAPVQRRGPPAPDPEPNRDAEAKRALALRLFLGAEERILRTPVHAYLVNRGIDLSDLKRQPRSIRYHPSLFNSETGKTWPAMVAAVTADAGDMIALHRTWLAQIDGRWVKAPLKVPKASLGRVTGGSIRLWRGASGKPLSRAPDGEAVAIGEGIETALSVVVACPELRVLSSVSLTNMANVALPATVGTVILLRDNDGDNPAAARAFNRAVAHFQAEGRVVRVAVPPIGADFNDTLLAAGTA